MRFDPVQRIEQARDVAFGLRLAPTLARVAVAFVEPPRRGFLDANRTHERKPLGQDRLRAITSAAVRGLQADSGAA